MAAAAPAAPAVAANAAAARVLVEALFVHDVKRDNVLKTPLAYALKALRPNEYKKNSATEHACIQTNGVLGWDCMKGVFVEQKQRRLVVSWKEEGDANAAKFIAAVGAPSAQARWTYGNGFPSVDNAVVARGYHLKNTHTRVAVWHL